MRVEGNIVDINSREIYSGSVVFDQGRIVSIDRHPTREKRYIMAGFIDAHLHIESSLLTPSHFGELVVGRGTVAVVTDPHEIANVLGVEGVEFMIRDSYNSPIRTHFTIPSSVPATPFDSAGGEISAEEVERLAASGRFVGLSEVMNIPGVLEGEEKIHKMIQTAHAHSLAIDGHAPLLGGDDLKRYASYGITTDHECSTLKEAEEKIKRGIKILIREGSAAKNYQKLKPLIASHPQSVMFCTDDSHPDDIISEGHIDKIVRRAIADDFDLFDVLTIASKSPITHYNLDRGGVLEVGARADFIVVDDLVDLRLYQSYIGGICRYHRDSECEVTASPSTTPINNFHHDPIRVEELRYAVEGTTPVVGLIEDEIVTRHESYTAKEAIPNLECDPSEDIVKIVYLNRYNNTPPVVALCRGFGVQRGAVASSISHDSHNIIAIGCSDREITEAINTIISSKGGLSVVCDGVVESLPLPIAGIMSTLSGEEVAKRYASLQQRVMEMGSSVKSPFMTLSFLSLVVIPELKIGEKGLFSYSLFGWI